MYNNCVIFHNEEKVRVKNYNYHRFHRSRSLSMWISYFKRDRGCYQVCSCVCYVQKQSSKCSHDEEWSGERKKLMIIIRDRLIFSLRNFSMSFKIQSFSCRWLHTIWEVCGWNFQVRNRLIFVPQVKIFYNGFTEFINVTHKYVENG